MPSRIFLMMAAVVLARVECHSEILDRIAVTVAKQVITEGDVILDLRVSAFLDQKPVDLAGAQKRKAADRLVDQLLILQEIGFSRIRLDTDEDAAQMLAQVKLQYGGDAGYLAALARYRLTEKDVSDHLVGGIRALRFTDLRFRPEIEINEDDLRDYYNKLSATARAKGDGSVATFESSHDDIEKLVIGERIAQGLDRWLGAQRTQTHILYHDPVFK